MSVSAIWRHCTHGGHDWTDVDADAADADAADADAAAAAGAGHSGKRGGDDMKNRGTRSYISRANADETWAEKNQARERKELLHDLKL